MVYQRTYSRTKPDGAKETWPETVRRVVDGNIALNPKHLLTNEREDLVAMMEAFEIIPAGRHLWASGTPKAYLNNCWVSGWPEEIWEHFRFTFLRLMEGGGVGANYSNRYLDGYGMVYGPHSVHIVCDKDHPDYQAMKEAGLLSTDYVGDWQGCFEVEDSREGWADALVDLLSTYYRDAKNTSRVFDVSRVRSAGARLKTFGGTASGPAPFARMMHEVSQTMNGLMCWRMDGMAAMEIDHAIAKCVVSGGNRRSARMAIMRWDDEQIEEFLTCKWDTGKHWTTNISVEVDEGFFEFLSGRAGDGLGANHAERVLDAIAHGMLNNGEPGIWNSSLSNEGEPNRVVCTNPCGEQVLEAWEPCNLGHVNLAAFVGPDGSIDEDRLMYAHRLVTRFLIRATECEINDDKAAEVRARNRRIGVGHFGFAAMLGKAGIRYSDSPLVLRIRGLLRNVAAVVDEEARRYSHMLRIPTPVKTRTVAPTGTIAKMPGVSEGIHPIYAKHFIRRIRFSTVDPDQLQTLIDYQKAGYKVEHCQYAPNTMLVEIPTKDSLLDEVELIHGADQADEIVESADELSLAEMLSVQAMYQELWADNAVSYTANIDPDEYDERQLADIIMVYGPRLKGMTCFPEFGMPQSPYERIDQGTYDSYATGDSVDEECANGGACPVR